MNQDTTAPTLQADQARLAGFLSAHAPYDGHFNLRLPGLEVIRASRTSGEWVAKTSRFCAIPICWINMGWGNSASILTI